MHPVASKICVWLVAPSVQLQVTRKIEYSVIYPASLGSKWFSMYWCLKSDFSTELCLIIG
jgi:hypothetical protein